MNLTIFAWYVGGKWIELILKDTYYVRYNGGRFVNELIVGSTLKSDSTLISAAILDYPGSQLALFSVSANSDPVLLNYIGGIGSPSSNFRISPNFRTSQLFFYENEPYVGIAYGSSSSVNDQWTYVGYRYKSGNSYLYGLLWLPTARNLIYVPNIKLYQDTSDPSFVYGIACSSEQSSASQYRRTISVLYRRNYEVFQSSTVRDDEIDNITSVDAVFDLDQTHFYVMGLGDLFYIITNLNLINKTFTLSSVTMKSTTGDKYYKSYFWKSSTTNECCILNQKLTSLDSYLANYLRFEMLYWSDGYDFNTFTDVTSSYSSIFYTINNGTQSFDTYNINLLGWIANNDLTKMIFAIYDGYYQYVEDRYPEPTRILFFMKKGNDWVDVTNYRSSIDDGFSQTILSTDSLYPASFFNYIPDSNLYSLFYTKSNAENYNWERGIFDLAPGFNI